MASIRGDKLTIKLQQNSSGTVNKVVAATTSCNVDVTAEALETTSQDDGINATFIPGKLSGTISGDYLTASDGGQYTNLYTHAGSGDVIEWEVYRDGTLFLNGTGVISSISQTGGNSDTLTTGAYSMSVQADDSAIPYGPELHTFANAVSDPNGNEADAIIGWNEGNLNGTGANVFESQSSVVNTGSYAYHAESNDTPTNNAAISFTPSLVIGQTYRVTFAWRHVGTGEDWRFRIAGVTKDAITNTDITWVEESFDFVAVSVSDTLQFIENGASGSGGIYLDNFSVKEVL